MNELNKYREEIERIDQEIINLFLKRMDTSKKIALYKKENNLPVLNSTREAELISKYSSYFDNEELKNYFLIFFKQILEISKDYQQEIIKKESKF